VQTDHLHDIETGLLGLKQTIEKLQHQEKNQETLKKLNVIQQQRNTLEKSFLKKFRGALTALQANVINAPASSDRPPDVQRNIEKSAQNIISIANTPDENTIADIARKRIGKLLT
jgi:hypothetical protein